MKTIDPHSLLDNPRTINVNDVVCKLFNIWKKLVTEKSNVTEFDSFVAGYFFGTNFSLREKYLKLEPEEK